jgi:hypothetical protein
MTASAAAVWGMCWERERGGISGRLMASIISLSSRTQRAHHAADCLLIAGDQEKKERERGERTTSSIFGFCEQARGDVSKTESTPQPVLSRSKNAEANIEHVRMRNGNYDNA